MNLIGKVLSNRYEILEEIGIGGMAYVYKAKCKLLNRYVAVKVLKEEYSKDDMFVRRFKAEAQSAASLTHPNIVQVYDVGEEDGINYIIMELLESRTLKDYIEEKGALSNEEIYKISIQIASALDAAHKQHIIHRDIKPQNIMLSKNLVAKVTDFGIAKATSTSTITNFGSTMGSVHYFSPEHAKGGYTDEKSDIYSLGVVMYEMSTGRVPFDSDSPVSVALKHIQEIPKEPIELNPNITENLNEIIMKAMAKNTASRFKSAAELLECLHQENGKKDIRKSSSNVEAGKTQILSVITDDMINNNVPNLRTRSNSRRMGVSRKELDDMSAQREEIMKKKSALDDEINLKMNNKNINPQDKHDKNKGSMSNKVMLIISIVLIVIALALASLFIVKLVKKMPGSNKSKEIEIPNVLGMTIEEINQTYGEQGITAEQTRVEFSSEYEAGKVISQSPLAGEMSRTKTISVVVSKGVHLVKVTGVKGKDLRVAKYELEDTLGFKVEVQYEKSEEVASGIIISQSVEEGVEAPAGSTIVLKVSEGDGKAKVPMPSVIGMTEAEAKETLKNLKLEVTTKTGEDTTKPNGTVIAQNYLQNYELKEGDLVEITINKTATTKKVTLDIAALLKSAGVSTEVPTPNVDKTTSDDKKDDDKKEDKENNVETQVQIPTATISVTASIDGGRETKSLYNKTVKVTDKTDTFEVTGYSSAVLTYFVNGGFVKTETITF